MSAVKKLRAPLLAVHMAKQWKPPILVQAGIFAIGWILIRLWDPLGLHAHDAKKAEAVPAAEASVATDPEPTVTALSPEDAPVYIASLDRAVVGATKQLEAGNFNEALAEARPMLQLQGVADQLWPDVVFDPTAGEQATRFDNMVNQNPLVRCRDAATRAETWWLYAHDTTDPRDAGIAEREMQGYLEDRAACLKGAPHFASWLKKVKAEKASEYTVKTNSPKPPHPGCLQVPDLENPDRPPYEWTCHK